MFAALHSVTVSHWFKRMVAGLVGERLMRGFYRLCFTMFSAAITLACGWVILTQPDVLLYKPSLPIVVAGRALQLAGLALVFAAFARTDAGSFTGVSQAAAHRRTGDAGGDIEGMPGGGLVTGGIYGLVRSPMYLGGILVFLFEPDVTENNLALRLMAVAYFAWGGLNEDRKMQGGFGDEYLEYRRRVPMFNIIAGVVRNWRGQ